jgi:hypothetical protein
MKTYYGRIHSIGDTPYCVTHQIPMQYSHDTPLDGVVIESWACSLCGAIEFRAKRDDDHDNHAGEMVAA